MRTTYWTPFVLLIAFGIVASGCMGAYGATYRTTSYRSAPPRTVHHVPSGYTSTLEYGRIVSDAERYADFLDRELHLSGRQERDIERLLVDRTLDLLRRTRVRDHYRVYPFPRANRSHITRGWWNAADYQIERVLHPRQQVEYRRIKYSFDRYAYGR